MKASNTPKSLDDLEKIFEASDIESLKVTPTGGDGATKKSGASATVAGE